MKNKLEADLKDLANKIIESKESNVTALKQQAKELYEKLTILAFTETNLANLDAEVAEVTEEADSRAQVTDASTPKEAVAQKETFTEREPVQEKDEYLPDGTEYNKGEAITEPNTEKIKDIVAQMPPETQKIDFMVNNIISKNSTPPVQKQPQKEEKKDFRDIGVDYDNLPNFEPVKRSQEKERPKSLNDRLKKGFNIGLNERLAFIRHLFEGNTADYNRVISQLNTFHSREEAESFIQSVVKPDYKQWQGKEEFEKKFMELVENKFDQ